MLNTSLLAQICKIPGAPGFEHRIRSFIKEKVSPFVDEVSIDAMGNLIALKKGKQSKRVMVAAHMDEISFIVTHVDQNGFIRFHPLGGFDSKTLTSQRVWIHGKEDVLGVMGCKPIHIMTAEERDKVVPIGQYFIDTGLPKEKVDELISIGDAITRDRDLVTMGTCVNGKSLDNRLSVFILLETLKALQHTEVPYDIYGVFTVQEEVGLRGAMASASHIAPHFGIGLDVTIAYDVPGSQPYESVTSLGKGTAIKVLDGSIICDQRMVAYMKKQAEANSTPYQLEILPKGGTDTAALQRYGKGGSIAGAISIPLRYIHQTTETASVEDIKGSIALLKNCLINIDAHEWNY